MQTSFITFVLYRSTSLTELLYNSRYISRCNQAVSLQERRKYDVEVVEADQWNILYQTYDMIDPYGGHTL